ncbi:6-carboxytetrahydropterin synthase QueD [Fervidobacterium pennivorans subsp. shakshaketiis]|jgi:6-pyruvoyltetrahydropterin/6-carboxytetrahydropterin synthase|uniref:6-carboxy-5,6,7,8-tetrahydropterin synthase n=1 Tax=Fervidobacterium pennivorans (strain DSM 9078 / Ven5) TaxID=771875 RepID=H9UF07_FERPD|nr:6-carboxytetrahydropterin synthase QueD [Fervidobacterium pennivorans]AFG36100.1 queuosine biosynthesis protein QueD [Fervidobacterium pennivorans DSM 9078]QIV79137.1 6-carboxytetrahydropterin synthase QueD [Fervidobacterium pennivorans subsp. keratinolyticus]
MLCVVKEFTFDAAHNLVQYHGKCEKLHGHTYKLQIVVCGEKDEEGMVIDFIELKEIVKREVLNYLDHAYINEIIPQPSAENIAEWIWERLEKYLTTERYKLTEVRLWETPTSWVVYRKD